MNDDDYDDDNDAQDIDYDNDDEKNDGDDDSGQGEVFKRLLPGIFSCVSIIPSLAMGHAKPSPATGPTKL